MEAWPASPAPTAATHCFLFPSRGSVPTVFGKEEEYGWNKIEGEEEGGKPIQLYYSRSVGLGCTSPTFLPN